MRKLLCCLSFLTLAGAARADDKAAAPAGMPDMTKMGPMSRPVTKEDKKGIDETYKAAEAAMKAGDANAMADLVDFPVIMLSDDSTGKAAHFNATREQWLAMMSPAMAAMPKDAKMKHKHNTTFLSDTLAVVVEETEVGQGKTKGKWKGFSVMTLKDGKWKWKQMAEAGWGDMKVPGATAAAAPTGSAVPAAKR
jgi:hypothetical protein